MKSRKKFYFNLNSIQVLFQIITCHEFIDQQLGLVLKNTSDYNVILTEGTLTIPSEIRIEIPTFKNTGQCSLHEHTLNQTSWLTKNDTSDYSKKIGALNALINADMKRESDKIVKKLQQRLGIVTSDKIFSENAMEEFEANPKLCDNPNYRCEFQVPAVAMKCTLNKGRQFHPEGHVLRGFKWEWTRSASYQNFNGLSCGSIITSGETADALVYNIGPSICCEAGSDRKYRSCPREAINAMNQYKSKSQDAEHTLIQGETYCISLLNMKKRPKTRKKRSFIKYWAVGGGLTSNYIDDKTHSVQTVLEKDIRELRNEITNNENIIQTITSTTSHAMSEIERLMCSNNLETWEEVMKLNVDEIINKARYEITNSYQACEQGNLPFSIEEDTIIKLCHAATQSTVRACRYITLLSSCITQDVLVEGNSILIHLELNLKLPSSENGLKFKKLNSFPVPNKALKSINKVISNDHSDSIQSQPDTDKNSTVKDTIENLFAKIIEKVNSKSRSKRSIKLYNYLQIDIPQLYIFYSESTPSNFVAFSECKSKPPIEYCSLGEHEYQGKTCLTAILNQSLTAIKASCPVKVTSGNSCIVTKLDTAFLISSYTKIEIFEADQSAKSIFASNNHECKEHSLCIVKQSNAQKYFFCNRLKYTLPGSKQKVISHNITLVNNTEFSLLNFNFQGINDSLEKLKFIKLPNRDPIIITSDRKDVIIWILMSILGTILILGISVLAYKFLKKNNTTRNNTTIVEIPLAQVPQNKTIGRTTSESSVRLLGI